VLLLGVLVLSQSYFQLLEALSERMDKLLSPAMQDGRPGCEDV
jgi:hypothetical protein